MALPNKYEIDSDVLLSVQFSNADTGAPADPTTILLLVLDPTGTETTYTFGVDLGLIRDDIGAYHMILSPTMSGVWIYKWQGTGDVVQTTPDQSFRVKPSSLITG